MGVSKTWEREDVVTEGQGPIQEDVMGLGFQSKYCQVH